MSPKKIPQKLVPKREYADYLKKAEEFYLSMKDDLRKSRWNSAALLAIHSSICANDALTVYHGGVKSSSSRHEDAVILLSSVVKAEHTKTKLSHLSKLLNKKNLVEYEGRNFTQKEADEASKHAERFLEWAKAVLP